MSWLARVWHWLWRNREEIVGVGEWAIDYVSTGTRRMTFCPTCKAKVPCTVVNGTFRAICPVHGQSK